MFYCSKREEPHTASVTITSTDQAPRCADHAKSLLHKNAISLKLLPLEPLQLHDNKQEIRSVELGVCPMQFFHFWLRDVHPVQNLLLCTKFHRNRMTSNARQHTDARYWYSKSVRLPSVCPPVCPLHSGIRWKRLNISSVFSPYGSPIIPVLPA